MYEYDFIVVGGGIAGSVLSYQLSERGQSVLMVSSGEIPSATRVAAGLFNPITGKYLTKTWLAYELFDYLEKFYPQVENQLQSKFYHPVGLFRPFSGTEHRVSAIAQIEKFSLHDFIEVIDSTEEYSEFYHAEMGGMMTARAGWIDTNMFLDLIKRYFIEKSNFLDEVFDYSQLIVKEGEAVRYKEKTAKNIVFCEGFFVKDNPYFNWVSLNPAKGEILDGIIEGYGIKPVVNQGKWIVPLGNGRVRLGATYSWDDLSFEPNKEDEKLLLETAEKILKKSFLVKDRQAGVRPSTKDRRPIIGQHPHYKNLFIFNGLGTKGISLAPYFSNQLIENILNGELINPEANIERFYTLYS